MRMRKKKNLVPRMERCDAVHVQDGFSMKGHWRDLMPGAKALLLSFFCYSAVETTAGLWASSYLTLHWGLDEVTAASWASFFYFGMTAGRAASGFITMRLDDTGMIRLGQSVLLIGIALLFLPVSEYTAMAGLVMVGLG